MKRQLWVVLIMLVCWTPKKSYGQNAPVKPKIGLVLSGGGAKGLAHIGV